MKKCPTCEKTFEDSMRFCQVDGTLLVDDAPAFDPYATIVAQSAPPAESEESPIEAAPESEESPIETAPESEESPIEAAPESEESSIETAADEEAAGEPGLHQTVGSVPIAPPEDVLDLPEADPLKTMYVSDSEMQAALGDDALADDAPADEPEIVEIPPIEEAPTPEPPSFSVPDVPAPSFGDITPPPSPFSPPDNVASEPEPEMPAFAAPDPPPPTFDEPARPTQFDEAETMIQSAMSTPFDEPSPMAAWTPPPAPDASWQNQEIGSNTPFQPPPAGGASSKSSTLAIISLAAGIIGCLTAFGQIIPLLGWVCLLGPFPLGVTAAITGFLARSRAVNSPDQYGGKGAATAGIILGIIGILLQIVMVVLMFVILGGMAAFGSR